MRRVAGLVLLCGLACAIGTDQALAQRRAAKTATCNFQTFSGWLESNLGAEGTWFMDFIPETRDVRGTFRLGWKDPNGKPRGHPEDEKTAQIMSISCKNNNFDLQEMNSSTGQNCHYFGKISRMNLRFVVVSRALTRLTGLVRRLLSLMLQLINAPGLRMFAD